MNLIPEAEHLRQAVKWISECRQDNPAAKIEQLIEQAAVRFNLCPKDEEFLARTLCAENK